ncbi:MAG TPA: putative peptidoglycan glycosyltransferase FtsW [Phycisphaerales bacterium]|nr:putative peptidoglycan glycosyltransferase FtsW [Phycisphaerales bacterium]
MPQTLRAGHGLILIVLTLLMIGVVMVTSAGLSIDPSRAITLRDVLTGRSMMLAILAMALMLFGTVVPVQNIYRARGVMSPIPWIVLGCVVLLLLVHVPGIGREVNAAKRWISVGPIGFQPSEVAKWGMLIVLAWHAARRAGAMGRLWTGFVPPMFLVAVVCGLIGKEDLGTAVLIGMVAICMLVAGGTKIWQVALLLPIGAFGIVVAIFTSTYRMNRIYAFMDAYQDPQGIGYHVLQSMAAVSGGGLAGRGLGNSIQKFGYLPEATTDFIFAIICEELGVVGAAVVMSLYAALLVLGFAIVRKAVHPFQRLLGLGILLTIGFQALINFAVVTGTAPTKGIALPLLSSGGTGWILTAFCIGLLVAIEGETVKRYNVEATKKLEEQEQAAHERAEREPYALEEAVEGVEEQGDVAAVGDEDVAAEPPLIVITRTPGAEKLPHSDAEAQPC